MEETKETTAEATETAEVTPSGEQKQNVEMKETTTVAKGDKDEEATARADDDKKEETVTAKETEETTTKSLQEEKEQASKKKRKSITPEAPSRTSKRSRKQVKEFQPDNFMAEKDAITIIEGRGTKCEDIPNVKEKIESLNNNSEEIIAAHKLLFRANIGKPASNHRKEHLLAFSGYLPKLVKEQDKEEREKSDEKIETKMSQKAYKLKVAELKMICDVFDVNRFPSTIDKDELIERLLGFLSAPDAKHTNKRKSKGSAKKKSSGKAKKKQEEEVEEEEGESEKEKEEEQESQEEQQETGKMPSDKALRKWVKAYVACFNTDDVTVNHAFETASSKFGVDMKEKKETLKKMLVEEM